MASFGVYLPNVGWEAVPRPSQLVEFAVAAEQLGFDSVWVEDRLLHPRVGVLEALTTLTYVAAHTRKVRLGTSILLVNLRNPLVVAKMLATLDYLSGGRVVLGASLGGRPEEYGAAGVTMKTRVTRFVETLRAIRAFWREAPFEGGSSLFAPTEVPMEPRPVQSPVPVWIGGRAEPVLRRVATLGDGWLASSMTDAEEFATGWRRVLEHAATAGRNAGSLEPAKFTYIHVADTAEEALAVLHQRLPRYYASYDVARSALYGPPPRCVERARTLLKAGVRTLIFATVADDKAQIERIASHILPELAS